MHLFSLIFVSPATGDDMEDYMKRIGLYIAGTFLIIHGLIEALSFVLVNSGVGSGQIFVFEQLQNNINATCALGVIFGIIRLVAALGVFLNRKWGLVLGLLISTITYIIITFYLPLGIVDGVLSGIVLISLLLTVYGRRPIVENPKNAD